MCRFCIEHGDGERWYLNAKNYSFDLESDLRRREYVVRFVQRFAETRNNAITWMDRISVLPAPVQELSKGVLSRRMQRHHFGQPVPLEECEQIFQMATSITVIPCICRMHTPGKHADEVCILVTTQPMEKYLVEGFSGYEEGPDLDDFRTVTATEATALLQECEDQGLMHSIWTFETPFTAAICNCNLESGCMAMKLTAGYEMKMMWRGESVATIDSSACTSCGACAKRCPFEAIENSRSSITLHAEKCWGCGICRSACRFAALSLVDRRSVASVAAIW